MIVATTERYGTLGVHGFCNRSETYGNPWLIIVPSGMSSFHYVAIAHDVESALNIYADSFHAHQTKLEVEPPPEEEEWYIQLGNCGEWHDLSNMTPDCVVPCQVNYFAKKEDLTL